MTALQRATEQEILHELGSRYRTLVIGGVAWNGDDTLTYSKGSNREAMGCNIVLNQILMMNMMRHSE